MSICIDAIAVCLIAPGNPSWHERRFLEYLQHLGALRCCVRRRTGIVSLLELFVSCFLSLSFINETGSWEDTVLRVTPRWGLHLLAHFFLSG